MRGLPLAHELDFEHEDGRVISARMAKVRGADEPTTATLVRTIEPGIAPLCPICLSPDPASEEHVPPRNFGGRVMILSCHRCNNGLGSRTEAAMLDWYDQAANVRFTSGASPEPFGHERALFLQTAAGEPVIYFPNSKNRENPLGRLRDPGVEIQVATPRPAEYRTGFLKSAFLAAVLNLRAVPITESFVQAREELLAARDAPRRREVVLGPMAESLRFHRTHAPSRGPALALLEVADGEHQAEPLYLISLAGTVLVEWPFPDLDPLVQFVP